MKVNRMICPTCHHVFYTTSAYGTCDSCNTFFYAIQSLRPKQEEMPFEKFIVERGPKLS